jgi:hypothetical protein
VPPETQATAERPEPKRISSTWRLLLNIRGLIIVHPDLLDRLRPKN